MPDKMNEVFFFLFAFLITRWNDELVLPSYTCFLELIMIITKDQIKYCFNEFDQCQNFKKEELI